MVSTGPDRAQTMTLPAFAEALQSLEQSPKREDG